MSEAVSRNKSGSFVDRFANFVKNNSASLSMWVVLVLMCAPMLYPYLVELWSREHYRYFPFAVLVAGYLVAVRCDGTVHSPRGFVGWGLVLFGICAVLASAMTAFSWFAALGFVLVGTSFFCSQRDSLGKSLLIVAVPFAMVLQLPFSSDTQLVVALQGITTRLSSLLLDLVQVPHAVNGNVIGLANRELFVAEACSGIQSVFTMAFLASVIVAWRPRRVWVAPIYFVIAVALAVFANVIRVTLIAVADSWYQLDWTAGWTHEAVGYACLGIAIGFLLSFDFLVASLGHEVAPDAGCNEANPFLRLWNVLAFSQSVEPGSVDPETVTTSSAPRWSGGAVSLLVCVIAICIPVGAAGLMQLMRAGERQGVGAADGEMLFDVPSSVGKFDSSWLTLADSKSVRDGTDPRLGANADLWVCSGEDMSAQFVISQPYQGWHELCVCYERQDWILVDRVRKEVKADGMLENLPMEDQVSYAVGRFKRTDGLMGYLFFSGIKPDGTIVEAPTRLGSFGTRFLGRMQYGGVWELEDVAMLQAWCVTKEKLSMEEYAKLEREFINFRTRAAENARRQAASTTSAGAGVSEQRSEEQD